jgi:hypothetical protein
MWELAGDAGRELARVTQRPDDQAGGGARRVAWLTASCQPSAALGQGKKGAARKRHAK